MKIKVKIHKKISKNFLLKCVKIIQNIDLIWYEITKLRKEKRGFKTKKTNSYQIIICKNPKNSNAIKILLWL